LKENTFVLTNVFNQQNCAFASFLFDWAIFFDVKKNLQLANWSDKRWAYVKNKLKFLCE
jgi:hypothetical protein